jgi:hypothetical protein
MMQVNIEHIYIYIYVYPLTTKKQKPRVVWQTHEPALRESVRLF